MGAAEEPSHAEGLAVVIVTYDSASDLECCVPALLPQLEDADELVVVDNSPGSQTADAARRLAPGAQVIQAGANLGFAGGANAGAAATRAPLLFFLNPDCVPAAGCLTSLRAAAREQPGWGSWQALVTLPGAKRVNTSGGVIHFLGFGWAGNHEQPVADAPRTPTEVPFASGAALVVRRSAWEQAGGFDQRYFMYGEDLDLSLRLWLAGWEVGLAPDARVAHDYEFEKGPEKWFLLERNRWQTILGVYPRELLVLLAPALVVFEVALLGVAALGGWLPQKLRAQAWVLGNLGPILSRRRLVQAGRRVESATFARRLEARLDSEFLGPAARIAPLVVIQRAYWAVVTVALRSGRGSPRARVRDRTGGSSNA